MNPSEMTSVKNCSRDKNPRREQEETSDTRIPAPIRFFNGEGLLTNNLDEHSFRAISVELAVENLLPRAEIELSPSYCYHDFASHDLPLEVSVGVVLAGAVVMVM